MARNGDVCRRIEKALRRYPKSRASARTMGELRRGLGLTGMPPLDFEANLRTLQKEKKVRVRKTDTKVSVSLAS